MASMSLITTRGLRLLPVAALCLSIDLVQPQNVADEEQFYGGSVFSQQGRGFSSGREAELDLSSGP